MQKAAFEVFDKDSNGDISKREMRDAVRRIYKERRALTASLKDVSSVVAKLDAVLISVALMILIFICLLIFSRNNTLASLVPLATIVVGFSFIFGHSAQTLFESVCRHTTVVYNRLPILCHVPVDLHLFDTRLRCRRPGYDRRLGKQISSMFECHPTDNLRGSLCSL